MNNLPFVTLVAINYNGEKLLPGFFSGIQILRYPGEKIEIIFVDDKSEDSSIHFVKTKFPKVKIIENVKNVGPAESRNRGMRQAQGEFIATLDNDVILTPDWLMELVKVMQADERVGICASKLLFQDRPKILNSAGGIINIFGDGWDRGIFQQDSGQYNKNERVFFGCSAAMIIRSSVVKKAGSFDRDYFYLYDDLDFGWRVNLAGYKVLYVPSAVAYHKFSHTMGNGILKTKYLIEKNRLMTLLKNYSARTLLRYLFRFMTSRCKKIARYKTNGSSPLLLFIVGLAAWLWNFINLPVILKKRRRVQGFVRKVCDSDITKIMGEWKHKTFGSAYEDSNCS